MIASNHPLEVLNTWAFWPILFFGWWGCEVAADKYRQYRGRKQADREREIDYRVQLALKNQTKKADS